MTAPRHHAPFLASAVASALLVLGCGSTEPAKRAKAPPARSEPATPDPVVAAGKVPAWTGTLVERCRRLEPALQAAADRHAMDVGLVAGIVRVESGFRPTVVSRAGAVGLMQVMPSNRAGLGCGDLRDVRDNLDCGLKVLGGFLRYYDDHLIYALSGYNAGYRTPNRARAVDGLPRNMRYVEKVLSARAAYLRDGCGS